MTQALLALYLAVVNLLGLLLMAADKRRASRGAWRIPERTLFLTALLGGSPGCLLGMACFRHKTRKPAFFIGMPMIFAAQVLLAVAVALHLSDRFFG